jgi:hypothetical protein
MDREEEDKDKDKDKISIYTNIIELLKQNSISSDTESES